MSDFALWFLWCIRLQQAREAAESNCNSVDYFIYVKAFRYAQRRCVQLERVLTGK